MVRVLPPGPKTQTRRALKHHAARLDPAWPFAVKPDDAALLARCPYGVPGDRLWVRETWGPCDGGFCYFADEPAGSKAKPDDGRWHPSIHMPRCASRTLLEVVSVRVERLQDISEADAMAEGIERENVIVDTHCAGGVHTEVSECRYFYSGGAEEGYEDAVSAYAALWDSINVNGPNSWAANPWVWVVSFKRIAP